MTCAHEGSTATVPRVADPFGEHPSAELPLSAKIPLFGGRIGRLATGAFD